MCGIFGIVRFDGRPADMAELGAMGRRMVHRGPDDQGFWLNGGVGLGMRRLAIIDLSGGRQPISNETGDIQVVLNGEIYNHAELRADLIQRGHRFSTKSDVEVLVHLYEERGRDCIHALNGMFAFALHDRKTGTTWIARDRIGIKPLYYTSTRKWFVFASDLKALNAVVRAPISISSIVAYLGYSYIPAPKTPYEGIWKLPPGEEFVIAEGHATNRRYWKLGDEQTELHDPARLEAFLENLLSDAVKLELQSDVPLGVFLSGGVDSSAVASYAAELTQGEPIRTFTIDFAEKGGGDAKFAKLVSRGLGSDHYELKVSAEDQFSALRELMPLLDEPMGDSAIVPTYMLSRAAREQGVKVLLSGAGGDEIFGGYQRHHPGKIGSAAWFASLPAPLRAALAPLWRAWNPALASRLGSPARNFAVMISGVNLAFLRDVLRDQDHFDGLLQMFDRDFQGADTPRSYPRMRLDLDRYLPDNILSLIDKATMAASIEGRVPLLDHRLVEFAFSMPESANLLGGAAKGLFRKVLGNRLPSVVLDRKKEGFNAPVNQWTANWSDRMRAELVGNTSNLLRDILDVNVLQSWIDDPSLHRRGGDLLYSLYVMNQWLATHGD